MAVSTAMSARKRRVVYGLNVAVTVVLAVAVLALVVWAAGAYGGRVDLTRAGVNSLSLRTVQLLRGLDEPITITGLYSTFLKDVRPHAEKHKNRVGDLLDLYETAARGKVTTRMVDPSDDPAQVTTLLRRLAEKPAYQDESAPHAEALDAFPALSASLIALMQDEMAELERLRDADPRVAEIRELGIIVRNLRLMLREAQGTETDLKTLESDEIPRYGRAVGLVTDYLEQVQQVLEGARDWMTGSGASVPGITDETKGFLEGAAQRYRAVLTDLKGLLDKAQDLKDVKLEDLYENLKRGQTVLVETPREALVLSQNEVWPWRTDRTAPEPPDGDSRDFAGEQAVSSAILKLTQKERTAVVFTRFGGQPLLRPAMPQGPMMQTPQAPYQALNELLQEQNFIMEEWDVQSQEDPPEIADAARTIFVVFPPEPPRQPNPMRPAPTPRINAQQKQRIFDAVKESGMAVFLSRWAPPSAPYIPIPEKYEFKNYLQSNWGVEVVDSHVALEFVPNPQREGLKVPAGRSALITSKVFRYTDHPIGKPLRGLPAAFQMVAPLKIDSEARPEGVTLEPVAVVDETEDVWAIKDLNRFTGDLQKNQGTRQYEDDIRSPFPLAIAATSDEGQKLVVLGSDRFVADAVTNMSQLVMVGGALRLAKLYPGNSDLFINALHWLTGNADRIAVGPQRGDIPRLEKLKAEGTLKFTRVFLVGIWPGLALLIGAGVWLLRRR